MKAVRDSILTLAAVACFTLPFSSSARDSQPGLDEIVGDGRFWMLTPDQFMSWYQPLGFRWNSAAKNSARVGNNINLWYHFDQFDPDVLKANRLRSSAGIKRFQKEIERAIDAGIPLLGTVTVGIFEEPGRISQTRGGHIRMIIGYNSARNGIIFTDSWGAGHEFKRWGIEEAYCSTEGLYSIQPTM